MQNACNKISIHGKSTGVQLLLETQKHAWFCYKLQDPGEEHWDNLLFISQLLYETIGFIGRNQKYYLWLEEKEKNRLFSNFTKAVQLFFLQWSVVNLSGTIEKFKILVIVLLQWIIRDQTLCYYYQLRLWCNLHLLFSRFAKNRDLLGRNASFSLQQWSFLLCHHSLYAEGVWVWEKSME